LVERGGEGRMTHMAYITGKNLREYVVRNASRKSRLHTDESRLYDGLGSEFASRETVHHAATEFARDDVATNTVEGMFGIFKRGMLGIYQHCANSIYSVFLTNSLSVGTIAASSGSRTGACSHRGLRHE
jgi:hypothetical protein